MKIILKILFTVCLINNIIYAHENDSTLKEQKIIESILTITQYSHQSKSNAVWPGYDLTQTPIIISFKNGHVFVLNHSSANPAFETLSLNGNKVQHSPKDLWGLSQTAFNPNYPFEGESAYVFNMDQAYRDPKKPLHVLVHERFHKYQFGHFNPPPILGNYQDHLNPENLALAKLEEKALLEFMQAKDEAQQGEYLRDFIAINSMRRLLIHIPSAAWEDHQQVMEGLADYVGYKMLGVLHLVPGFDARQELAQALRKEFMGEDYSDHAIKWRHYSIGASIGYILDGLKVPYWKKRIEQGQATLQEILNETVHMSSQEMENRFEKAKIAYGYEDIYDKIAATTHKFETEIQSMMDSYEKLNGIIVSIGNPGKGLSGSGYNERMLYLPDGTTLSINDNLKSLSDDNFWKLQLKNIPYLFKKGSGEIEFKVDASCEILIDRQTFPIQEWISQSVRCILNK